MSRPREAPPDEQACSPCRGSGIVLSHLGGTRSEVTCPWCDGTGRFQRDHDAQAARRGGGVVHPAGQMASP